MRITTRLLVVSAAALTASCGSTSRADAERQRYIADNDRICAAVAAATLDALRATFPVPNGLPDAAAARRTGPACVAAYRHALTQRQRLAPPSGDKSRFQEHFARYAEALDDLTAVHDRIQASTTPTDYRAWLTPVSEEFYRLNDFEKTYGFKICGSEPGPNSR
jgi:hypothetical protein